MADKLVNSNSNQDVVERYRDMGEGVFAREVVPSYGPSGVTAVPQLPFSQ